MEDEHQDTLKKKIQILFQLGKWPDVIRLCSTYAEKYGKEAEIEMIRFKSERHMGIPAPATAPVPGAGTPHSKDGEEPLLLAPKEVAVEEPAVPPSAPAFSAESPEAADSAMSFAPPFREEQASEDPFADEELIITDPFAEDGPGIQFAPEEPLVMIGGESTEGKAEAGGLPALEMEEPGGLSPVPPGEEEPDFANMGSLTIDAEPELVQSEFPADVRTEPAGSFQQSEKEEPLEDLSHSASGSFDVVEEPGEAVPIPEFVPTREETPRRPYVPVPETLGQKVPAPRRAFPLKFVLLVLLPLLAVAALWLALTGKLNFSGGEEPPPLQEPASRPPVVKPPIAKPPSVVPPETSRVDEKERIFTEKLQQAEKLYKMGELSQAMAILQEAKKIKVTEPLNRLEEELTRKVNAAAMSAKPETTEVVDPWQRENDAFSKAEDANTIVAWKEFLQKYPDGDLAVRAVKKIAFLEKQAQKNADRQLQQKIQQAQKVKLRAAYMNLSQAQVASLASQGGRPPAQFQLHEHGGAKVMLEFTAGLMWTLWSKPMDYNKAKWWANRVTAGYSGWRLPTTEETLSLLKMDRSHYSGLPGFAVWTGDPVSDAPRTVWVFKLPAGQFAATGHDQMAYVWAVRKAVK